MPITSVSDGSTPVVMDSSCSSSRSSSISPTGVSTCSLDGQAEENLRRILRPSGIDLIRKVSNSLLGAVYIGRQQKRKSFNNNNINDIVILKVNLDLKEVELSNRSCESFKLELKALMSIPRHPNVIDFERLIDVREERTHIMMLEYLEGGDLLDFVQFQGYLQEDHARNLFVQILNGLKHIHRNGFCHRDVSLENILLTKDLGSVKICDFAQAVEMSLGKFYQMGNVIPGKPKFVSPEVLQSRQGDFIDGISSDLYSLGVVLFCMLFGYHPYELPSDSCLPYFLLMNGEFPSFLEYYGLMPNPDEDEFEEESKSSHLCESTMQVSAEAFDLLSKLLCRKDCRIDLDQVLQHPWIAALNKLE